MKKVLLDECVPHGLRKHLSNHDTITAAYAGLAGFKNGALLKAAVERGFDVLVTGDKTLQHEQNHADNRIALISLSDNRWQSVKLHLAKIAAAVDQSTPGSFVRVECGAFVRRRKPSMEPGFG